MRTTVLLPTTGRQSWQAGQRQRWQHDARVDQVKVFLGEVVNCPMNDNLSLCSLPGCGDSRASFTNDKEQSWALRGLLDPEARNNPQESSSKLKAFVRKDAMPSSDGMISTLCVGVRINTIPLQVLQWYCNYQRARASSPIVNANPAAARMCSRRMHRVMGWPVEYYGRRHPC